MFDGQTAKPPASVPPRSWIARIDVSCSGNKAGRGKDRKIIKICNSLKIHTHTHTPYHKATRSNKTQVLHLGGYTSNKFDISGFKDLVVIHIPLATFLLSPLTLSFGRFSWEEATGNGTVKVGSKTSWWLNRFWPETILTPLYCPLSCKVSSHK